MTATTPLNAASATPASTLNALLAEMHGPTMCLASTMHKMTPFPAIAALPDADVLDLHVSLIASGNPDFQLHGTQLHGTHDRVAGSVTAHAKARYATKATAPEAAAFYKTQLDGVSDDVTTIIGAPDGADAHFDAAFGPGRYCARIFDLGRETTVMVQTENTQAGAAVPFSDLANWHGFRSLDGAIVYRCEVFTVAAGRSAPVQAIYSTEYGFPGMATCDVRSMIDALLMRRGWAATETFEDSLLFDGAFEGEAHVAGHDGAARLTMVGEYPLPSEGLHTPIWPAS